MNTATYHIHGRMRPLPRISGPVARRLAINLTMAGMLGTICYANLSSLQTPLTNNQVHALSAQPITMPTKAVFSVPKLPVGVDTKPISSEEIKNYSVDNNLPRAIYINNINVTARIIPLGLVGERSLQLPSNSNDAGWYTTSAKPGKPGAMIIDGHSSQTDTHEGLFGNISELKDGDHITIERGDGMGFSYTVVHTEVVALAGVSIGELLTPYGGASQGINLVAPTGEWNDALNTLDHRLIVSAVID